MHIVCSLYNYNAYVLVCMRSAGKCHRICTRGVSATKKSGAEPEILPYEIHTSMKNVNIYAFTLRSNAE